jgi:hypothetical protein
MAVSEPKKSKITFVAFSSSWTNPKGNLVYYHDITFENGDTGSIGVMEKNSEKIAKGKTIWYTIDGTKIKKMDAPESKSGNTRTQSSPRGGGKGRKSYNPEDYLGYTWGYAKDLIIAGKTMKDFEELKKVANAIYAEITEMLENGSNQDDNTPF